MQWIRRDGWRWFPVLPLHFRNVRPSNPTRDRGVLPQYCWHSRANRLPFLLQRMKRYLPFLIVGFVALVTFGGGFALYRARKPAPLKDAAASGIHARGKPGAPVTIEEFGDFQCP